MAGGGGRGGGNGAGLAGWVGGCLYCMRVCVCERESVCVCVHARASFQV